jgi:hypothetical protein
LTCLGGQNQIRHYPPEPATGEGEESPQLRSLFGLSSFCEAEDLLFVFASVVAVICSLPHRSDFLAKLHIVSAQLFHKLSPKNPVKPPNQTTHY